MHLQKLKAATTTHQQLLKRRLQYISQFISIPN